VAKGAAPAKAGKRNFHDLIIASDAACQSTVAGMPDQTQPPIIVAALIRSELELLAIET
jgi:hypothetical protein